MENSPRRGRETLPATFERVQTGKSVKCKNCKIFINPSAALLHE